jgi:flagellar biosynthesis protein
MVNANFTMLPQNGTMTERTYDLTKTAVAVKGQDGRQATMLAKGRGAVAEQILDLAFSNGVKIREDKALSQMLEAYELESPIPLPALEAVCKLLCHVYAATHAPKPEGF